MMLSMPSLYSVNVNMVVVSIKLFCYVEQGGLCVIGRKFAQQTLPTKSLIAFKTQTCGL
jgi:hypothetical protein